MTNQKNLLCQYFVYIHFLYWAKLCPRNPLKTSIKGNAIPFTQVWMWELGSNECVICWKNLVNAFVVPSKQTNESLRIQTIH